MTIIKIFELMHFEVCDLSLRISVEMTEDGRQALFKLAKGDMRRVLNIMQSTSAAYGVVNETNVYMTTGQPQPKDIERIVSWLLEQDYSLAYQCIQLHSHHYEQIYL